MIILLITIPLSNISLNELKALVKENGEIQDER